MRLVHVSLLRDRFVSTCEQLLLSPEVPCSIDVPPVLEACSDTKALRILDSGLGNERNNVFPAT